MAKPDTLKEIFVIKIQALYDVENELVKALPKLAKAATNPRLKKAFTSHLEETRAHVERLEEVFDILGEKKKKLPGDAIRGLAQDAAWCVKSIKPGDALDLAVIAAARAAEHYEIAGYLSAGEWAAAMENEDIISLLGETLDEEEAADEALAEISEEIEDRLAE